MTNEAPWEVLTRRTDVPKLTWLMRSLSRLAVPHRLNGSSFHAPILETRDAERANRVLTPVDNLPDDDAAFTSESSAWWMQHLHDEEIGTTIGAIGVTAHAIREVIAQEVSCRLEGAPVDDCPFACGAVPECPAQLWTACHPMVRLETFCLSLAEVLPVRDDIARHVQEMVDALTKEHGQEALLPSMHVLATWFTNDMLELAAGRRCDYEAIAGLVSAELVPTQDGLAPLRSEVNFDEAVRHGFEPDQN